MPNCLICSNHIEPFISFGKMPIANGFLTPDRFDQEFFFQLKVGFCPRCHMVQLTETVDREKMFHNEYAFYSSTSSRMAEHFRRFADSVIERSSTGPDPFVVEIGSNDGILLQHFSGRGIRHLGIEPSANVANEARKKKVNTISSFFDAEIADQIITEHGQADVLLGANVFCHIPYLHSVADGAKKLLKPLGILIFEDPYLGDIIEKTSYDQIYDEHTFYFSCSSVKYLFEQHDMELVDAQPQHTHGGSMRYFIAHRGTQPQSARLLEWLRNEEQLGLSDPGTYIDLRHRIEESRDRLSALLQKIRSDNKRVVGYGATSKSTTVINYCGITPDLVDFISDTTPIKQGKFSPGAHIPVKEYSEFKACYPDYALLFAWNHSEEIMEKEHEFRHTGGRWIVYVPQVGVIE